MKRGLLVLFILVFLVANVSSILYPGENKASISEADCDSGFGGSIDSSISGTVYLDIWDVYGNNKYIALDGTGNFNIPSSSIKNVGSNFEGQWLWVGLKKGDDYIDLGACPSSGIENCNYENGGYWFTTDYTSCNGENSNPGETICGIANGSKIQDYANANGLSAHNLTIAKLSGASNAHVDGSYYYLNGTFESYCNHCVTHTFSSTTSKWSLIEHLFQEIFNPNYLYCSFEGDRTCSADTLGGPVLALSSETNAHAEIPGLGNYAYESCFGDLSCKNFTGSCSSNYPIEMYSLSSDTNAHIGAFDDYPVKICCKHDFIEPDCGDGNIDSSIGEVCDGNLLGGKTCSSVNPRFTGGTLACSADCKSFDTSGCEEPQGTAAYWADGSGNLVSEAKLGETVKLKVVELEGINSGESLKFEIYESNWWFFSDNHIKTLNAVASTTGKTAEASWTIGRVDLAQADDFDDFIFLVYDSQDTEVSSSNSLLIDEGEQGCDLIHTCEDYVTQSECVQDECGADALIDSVVDFTELGNASCGDTLEWDDPDCIYYLECSCSWESSSCGSGWDVKKSTCDYENSPETIGSCSYSQVQQDDCSDGILDLSWKATWTWGSDNGWTEEQNWGEANDFVLVNGKYYYDPEGVRNSCQDRTKTLPCSSGVQLGFFNKLNFIAALFLILGIYFLYNKDKLKR